MSTLSSRKFRPMFSSSMLPSLFVARFGEPYSERTKRNLLHELLAFHRHLVDQGQKPSMSTRGIKNWFSDEKGFLPPTKVNAKRFLYGYLKWIAARGYGQEAEAKLVYDRLDAELSAYAPALESSTASSATKKAISIEVPAAGYGNSKRTTSKLNDWLCGVYICYRYSFERSIERYVAREVLHVKQENNGTFTFAMSFLPGSGEGSEDIETFEGIVLPFSNSIFFAGWDAHRGRSLFMYRDEGIAWRECRFAILSSTRHSAPYYPVAACTVIIKINQKSQVDVLRFMRQATRIRPFNEIIKADFGVGAMEAMRTFIDNTPSNIRTDGNAREEALLRLNLDRFEGRMFDIVENVRKSELLMRHLR